MEQEKNPTVFASLTCGIVNELFGKVLKDFIRHVHFTNCILPIVSLIFTLKLFECHF